MRIDKVLKEKAVSLRLAGQSYSQIQKTLGLKSKGTLSLWFKGLILTKNAESLLERNNKLAHDRGLFIFNENRTKSIALENANFVKEGVKMIDELNQNSLLLIGIILYWAEGTKSEKSNTCLSFSNSDPAMISSFVKFLTNFLDIKKEKIRGGIHLYPDTNINKAKKYWSKIASLPKNKFYIVNQVSISSQGKRPYNKLPYGTAVIRAGGRKHFYLMKGMIEGIKEKLNI
jgi:hypothetical protein